MRALHMAALLAAAALPCPAADPVRVLLVTGQNNHDWARTAPVVEEILEQTGRFAVDVELHPESLTAAKLEPYAAILSHWNAFGKGAAPWPEEARAAYVAFVRGGKGHVALHAGSSSFYDWPDYQQVGIAAWGNGKTGHGPVHRFPVRKAAKHAIVDGLAEFTTQDELWHRAAVQEGAEVLAEAFSAADRSGSGAWEPVAFVRPFGGGRCFTLLLGHDVAAMQSPGFRALLARGTEWAATGAVTLSAPSTPPPLTWEKSERGLALARDGRVLWRLHTEGPKPFFHPVALSSGEVLTWESPPDHPWHRGLWFSWKYINGVNYWEEDRATGQGEGVTEVVYRDVEEFEDFSAQVRMGVRYRPQGSSNEVLREVRTIDVSAPDASGGYRLDWTMSFTAKDSDVRLDRTPLPSEPGGKSWGGYAGLSARLAKDFTNVQVVSTAETGPLAENRLRFRAAATDLAGQIGGRDCGIAILDHPANLNAPSPWYVIVDPRTPFVYFSPAVIHDGPHVIPAGGQLELRYRVIVHEGRWTRERLQAEVDAYTKN
jgi:type 1 glutamine amidotransferase